MASILRRLSPPPLRLALVMMVGAYPLVTGLLALLAPFVGGWPLPVRTLVFVPCMVLGMTFVITPLVRRLAGGWIDAGRHRPQDAAEEAGRTLEPEAAGG